MTEIVVTAGPSNLGRGGLVAGFGLTIVLDGRWLGYVIGVPILLLGLLVCLVVLRPSRAAQGVVLSPQGVRSTGRPLAWEARWDEIARASVVTEESHRSGTRSTSPFPKVRVSLLLKPVDGGFGARNPKLDPLPTGSYLIYVGDTLAAEHRLKAALSVLAPERVAGPRRTSSTLPWQLVAGETLSGVAWLAWLAIMIMKPDPDVPLIALVWLGVLLWLYGLWRRVPLVTRATVPAGIAVCAVLCWVTLLADAKNVAGQAATGVLLVGMLLLAHRRTQAWLELRLCEKDAE